MNTNSFDEPGDLEHQRAHHDCWEGDDDYVDVESVRFTMTTSASGDTEHHPADQHREPGDRGVVADVDVTGTMDVSSDFAIGTTKFKRGERGD